MKKEFTEEERMAKIEDFVYNMVFAQAQLKGMGERPTTKTEGEVWDRRQELLKSKIRYNLRKIERQTYLIAQEY